MLRNSIGRIAALAITLLTLVQSPVQAASYYLSANGNDANPGTDTQPWRSLARLQTALDSAVLHAGDQVLFARGDRFSGTLTLGARVSGNAAAPITFGAYGTGNAPVLRGMQTLSGWQALGNNRWRAVCSACSSSIPASLVIEGVPQPLARWPNLDEGDGGYRYYSSYSGRTSITDNTLPANPNWTGGELVLRTVAWVLDRLPIVSQTGGTLVTSSSASYDIGVNGTGYGYFVQNHLAALDRDGEWVYAASDKSITLQWPVNPSTFVVEVPIVSTLITIRDSQYITLQDLELRGAQNDLMNADSDRCANLVLERVALRYAGDRALVLSRCPNSRLSQSLVVDSMNRGLQMNACADCRVDQTTLERIGVFAGMGRNGDLTYTGMWIGGTSGHPAVVENSVVSGIGYVGIRLFGPAVARQNIVRGWNRAKTDGGGINTWHEADFSILDNILVDAQGSKAGTPYSSALTHGIYLDDNSERITVSGNTIARVSGAGIVLHDTRDVTVTNNLVFDTREAGLLLNDDNSDPASYGVQRSLIRDNTVIVSGVPVIGVMNSKTASLFDTLGPINDNRYCDPFGPPQFQVQLLGGSNAVKSLAQWRTDQARDLTTTVCPDRYSTHVVTGTPGPNRVTNGTFDSNLNGWFGWPPDTLDATRETGRLDGGSLRLGYKGPATTFHYDNPFGAVLAGQTYRLRMSAAGILGTPSVTAYLRRTSSPFTLMSETRPVWVVSQRNEFEIFFDVSGNQSDNLLIFEMNSPGSAVGIDNVVLQAVTATQQTLADVTQCTGGALSVAGSTTAVQPSLCPILLATGGTPPIYEGLWWADPPGSESGWGINFAHQGEVIFVTWFTYDLTGKAWWLTMTANKIAEGVYSGGLYQTRGPAFSAVPFNSAAVTVTPVGFGTLYFSDSNTGSFTYTVNGVTQTKAITRQSFGTLPTCRFGTQPDLTQATNYQDLWWASPAGAESGWGVNFTHQNDTIFATWFTYDIDGTPLWLSATAPKTGPGIYSGTLYRTTGSAFNAVPFLPANVVLTPVGTLTLTFANGNTASYKYTVTLPGQSSVTQTKPITRQVFRAPGTVCQ